jgi:DNA-binding transcriptional ArsR family regulator
MKRDVRILVVVASLLAATAVVPAVAGAASAQQLDDDDDGNLTDALEGVVSTTGRVLNDTTETVENTTNETTDTVENTTEETTETVETTSDSLEATTEETIETSSETLDDTTDTTTETVDGTTDTLSDALASRSTLERLLESHQELENEGFPAAGTGSTTATPTETPTTGGAVAGSDADAGAVPGGDGTGDDAEADARRLLAPSTSVPLPDAGATATGMAGLGAVAAGLVAVQSGAGSTLRGTGSMLRGTGARLRGTGARLRGVGRSTASVLERVVRAIAPLRYSRYDDSDPLEHDARAAVFDEISAQPGTYLSAVADRADVPLSTARHHLKVLEREGLVEGTKVRGRRRLYPAHADGKALAAALAEPATAGVLATLARLGPSSASAVADEVDVTVSTVSHHLSRLEEDGLVEREREGQAVLNRLPPEVADAFADEAGVEPAEEPAAVGAD